MAQFNSVQLSDKQIDFISKRTGVMSIFASATVFG
jgi:hypothetical protein